MAFDSLPTIETPDKYLDLAFATARKESREYNLKEHEKDRRDHILGVIRVKAVREDLVKRFQAIISQYPNFDNLSEFYTQLMKATLDYAKLKKSLGSVNWAILQIKQLTRDTIKGLKGASNQDRVNAYYGRVGSVLKQIKGELKYLHEVRQILRNYPSIKEGMFTVCIAGFPNVGKSTLLSQITPAKPEINKYAFTTKRLNLGYATKRGLKIQFIDTPGTLNREEKMNLIEKQAYLAMRYVADAIIYVFDLTESGYNLADQMKLYERVKETHKPLFVYLSKTDLFDVNEKKFTLGHYVDRDVLLDKVFSQARS